MITVYLDPSTLAMLCECMEDRDRFVRTMRSFCPEASLALLPFQPRRRKPKHRLLIVPTACQQDYPGEMVVGCDRFDLFEKTTLMGCIGLLQMRIRLAAGE
ncbi:MAG: hypothetical protein V4568_06440 [Pseudomonadota bacterium]